MRLFAVALIMLLSTTAFADAVDQLGQALLTDRSLQVRVQAALVLDKMKDRRGVGMLITALRDKDPALRVVAASSLGKLGDRAALPTLQALAADPDPVLRSAMAKAVAAIEASGDSGGGGSGGTAGSRYSLEISPTACTLGIPEVTRSTNKELSAQLGRLRSVTLLPAPGVPRYFMDTKISKLSAGPPDSSGRVQIDCDLSIIVATYPDHAIKMMATVGGSLDERNDPRGIAEAKNACLVDAAKQAAEKVQTYLQGVR